MKKLFTLFTALLVVCVACAKPIKINTGTVDALRVALYNANDGDEIVMAAGTYVESNSNFIAFDKNITVRAEEGATVIVQPKVSATISGGKRVKLIGIKWDAQYLQTLQTWYEHVIYASDDSEGNVLILENCEFYNHHYYPYKEGVKQPLQGSSTIFCGGDKKLDSVIVNNCKFHDITKSCMFFQNTGMKGLIITNSSIYNIAQGSTTNYFAAVIDSRATAGTFLVDHCTFYNVIPMNTDYAAIGNNSVTITGSAVNNSIFVLPTSQDGIRAIRGVSAANNCLTFNYVKDGGGIYSTVAQTACKKNQDPLFVSAASANFTLGLTSPALNSATDGSSLGDPRWWPTYTRTGLSNGTWGTICLPTAVSSLPSDVKFYKVNGKRMSGETPTAIVLDEVASLEAGKPYIFHVIADMSDFTLTCASSATTASAASVNGLIGTDVMQSVANGKYIIYNGEVCKVNGATVTCGAHRAYFDLSTMEETTVPAGAPGIREIPMAPETTTSMADIESEEKAIKFFQNGQLYILRDGVTYDAVGRIIR